MDNDVGKYTGKKIVVTGGTIGIGRAIAEALLAGGAEVLLTGRSERNLDAARRALGSQAHVVRSDAASMADIDDLGAFVFTTVTPATGTPTMSVYSGSKAALRSFAQVLAAELLPRRIRVNAVAPGFIKTPTMGIAGASEADRTALEKAGDAVTPMKRHGTAEEVARAALFLAFDATFTTGAELPVDGGLSQVDAPPE